jgi:hypothetical protein
MSGAERARLAVGTRLGPYEILGLLGAGGMGEVYRARDPRLAREVAVKVLPAELSMDAARVSRFEQEARAAGALNHPNVLAVYDTGRHDGIVYVIFELLEGQTLRQRLDAVPLAPAKAVELGVQIAHGLAAAHERGIVHRDLKPENVLVTRDGRVKILDFGLAKLRRALDDHAAASDVETPSEITERGTVVGTPGYMSPEQVKGQPVDPRSDVFSFGSVLYEMVAAKRPFDAGTSAETMTAILKEDPPHLPAATPPALERIVKRCLEKRPDERFQSARDVAFALEALSGPGGLRPRSVSGTVMRRLSARRGISAAVLAMGLVTVAALGVRHVRKAPPLTDRDSIVLSDFENRTGDAVFDGALRQALAIQLEQSPYLLIHPEARVRQVLRLMGRSPDDKLTSGVAREVCQREGIKAMLSGAIGNLGTAYVIDLEAINCETADVLAREQGQAASREAVLRTLARAATSIRRKLGESLPTIRALGRHEEFTTSSLEALKLYAAATNAQAQSGRAAAVPLYQKVLELDPHFAMVHARLAGLYLPQGEEALAAKHIERAFELRDRVTAREKYFIEARYYHHPKPDLRRAIETLEVWRRTYPRDWQPRMQLSVLYRFWGEPEKALEAGLEALAIQAQPANFVQVSAAYQALGRWEDGKRVLEQALAQNVDGLGIRQNLFAIAFVQRDEAAQRRAVNWKKGDPEEWLLYDTRAAAEESQGRFRAARDLRRQAFELSLRRGFPNDAAYNSVIAAFREAEAGNAPEARRAMQYALDRNRRGARLLLGAVALARAGDVSGAEQLVAGIDGARKDLYFDLHLSWARAQIALARGAPQTALALLDWMRPYDRGLIGFNAQYLRGSAYLRLRRPQDAAAEFRKIIAHRGQDSLSMCFPLAHLGLARAQAAANDPAARGSYEDFLALWKDADPDLPILVEAQQEYRKLSAAARKAGGA